MIDRLDAAAAGSKPSGQQLGILLLSFFLHPSILPSLLFTSFSLFRQSIPSLLVLHSPPLSLFNPGGTWVKKKPALFL